MERYYGIETATLYKMRSDFMRTLQHAVHENTQYPTDGLLYQRVQRMAREISDLTQELESRNDEQIEV